MSSMPRSAVGLAVTSRVSPLGGAAGRPFCPGRLHPCTPTSPETTPAICCGWRIGQGTLIARPAPRRVCAVARDSIGCIDSSSVVAASPVDAAFFCHEGDWKQQERIFPVGDGCNR